MSFFGSILEKLGFNAQAEPTPVATGGPEAGGSTAGPAGAVVDIVSLLERRAATHGEKLNWKTSIVDLLKLLGLDSSLEARKALATELACPAEKMGDSAQMNLWLHQTVLKKLAENGGNVPPDLLT